MSLLWGKCSVAPIPWCWQCHRVANGDPPPIPAVPWCHDPTLCAADNPSLLTIQPDLSTATMTYQGSLCPRQDGPAKLQLPNGHLLSPLGTGRHTLHHSSPVAEGADFVARLSTQSYFRSLPRGTSNMAYGTFNFLGGRLMIPNTGTVGWAQGAGASPAAGSSPMGLTPLPACTPTPRDQPAHPTRCHTAGENLRGLPDPTQAGGGEVGTAAKAWGHRGAAGGGDGCAQLPPWLPQAAPGWLPDAAEPHCQLRPPWGPPHPPRHPGHGSLRGGQR